MKTAIIYKSVTGNTKTAAEAVKEAVAEANGELVYYGEPQENETEAELYFVGSWTDKGACCEEISSFLQTLENKKIAYFGTAGFGGSAEYYHTLFERISEKIPASNEKIEPFFCQGKMPQGVRTRYEKMLETKKDDEKIKASIRNFDEALVHPNAEDVKQIKEWAKHAMSICE